MITRALTCYRHAVFALCWFRENRDVAALARDHGISRATGYRYLDEVITVLAEQAPDLHETITPSQAGRLANVVGPLRELHGGGPIHPG